MTRLNRLIEAENLEWRVYNDYPMPAASRRHLSADLALVAPSDDVVVAAEFKYEPCRRRLDVLQSKLPMTVWADILKDTDRVRVFVEAGKCPGRLRDLHR